MNKRQKTILVAEDDTEINKLICKILEKGGYRAVSAFSGTEAELRFGMEIVDMVILDLMMPGMDGESFFEKFEQQKIRNSSFGSFGKISAGRQGNPFNKRGRRLYDEAF